MNIIERYLEENQKATPVWEVYLEILKEKGMKDFDVVATYAKYLKNITSKYRTEEIKKLELFTLETFKEQMRKWNPNFRRVSKFGVAPNDERYIIIAAFLSGFDAYETNELLIASGLAALHGRSPLYCAYIYCLNAAKSYDECILDVYPKVQKIVGEVNSNANLFTIDSIKSLEKYVDENRKNDEVAASIRNLKILTQEMTEELLETTSEADFYKYIQDNVENFLTYREAPRRYLCTSLLRFMKEKDYISTYKSFKFSKLISSIWGDFNDFYYNLTTISVFDGMNFFRDLDDNTLIDEIGNSVSDILLKYIQGKKQIQRKTLLLFLYFLGEKEYLNSICYQCDFNTIDSENKSLFDTVFCAIVDRNNKTTLIEILEEKFSEIYLVKIYCDILYLKEIKTYKKIGEYKNIVDNLIVRLESIEVINEKNNLLAKNILDIFYCLKGIENIAGDLEKLEKCNDILEILNQKSFNSENIQALMSELNVDEKTRIEGSNSNTRDIKYLQNPLYLSSDNYL